MTKIVCIDTGTTGLKSEIDDIVSVIDYYVELTGGGYKNFKIYEVKNVTDEEVRKKYEEIIPEQKFAFRLNVNKNIWTNNAPEKRLTWKNLSGKWCSLEQPPKHSLTLSGLSVEDKNNLALEKVNKEGTLLILGKCTEKIHLNSVNNTEIVELNK